MIRRTKVDPVEVKGLARTQLEAFKAKPALLGGMMAPAEEIEARLTKILAAADAHEHLVKAAKAAKEGVEDEMWELRQVLLGNINLTATRYGFSAAEVGELGGKPRPIRRRTKSEVAPGAAESGK